MRNKKKAILPTMRWMHKEMGMVAQNKKKT